MNIPRRVVITGAAGALGRVIRAYLTAEGRYELSLIDRDPGGDPEIQVADLALWQERWPALFEGAHAVLHLAGVPSSLRAWSELARDNIDATLQVFEAAARGGARRVVFASSLHVLWGHGDRPIPPGEPPAPVSAYGTSKAAGERIARVYAERSGISVICFRIGAVRPEPFPPSASLAVQRRWLSHRDLCQGFERAIEIEDVRFAVLNLLSDNRGSPWDLSETRQVLGYRPADACEPRRPSPWSRSVRRLARLRRRLRGPR
ncbi:MAG TPA: NAD(P)-dependent oxidoreductase [Candidatus Polarisedimenticolia bacterium]|nr:NAD(P)-dependent oxidoreductase [Candidatus Polarisedimenticolia bacterium]